MALTESREKLAKTLNPPQNPTEIKSPIFLFTLFFYSMANDITNDPIILHIKMAKILLLIIEHIQ